MEGCTANVIATDLPGVLRLGPKVFGDPRGFFMETWQAARYSEAGMPERFVQDNHSRSRRGVLRGLHNNWFNCRSPFARAVRPRARAAPASS